MSDLNKKTTKKKREFWNWFWWLVVGGLAVVLTCYVFNFKEDNGSNWSASVLSALLGVALTVVITRMLLSKQSSIQSEFAAMQSKLDQDRKNKEEFNSSKLQAYSTFVLSMNSLVNDNKVSPEKIKDLKNELFGKISFYAEDTVLDAIREALSSIESQDFIDDENQKLSGSARKVFNKITCILRKDISKNEVTPDTLDKLNTSFETLLSVAEVNSSETGENEDLEVSKNDEHSDNISDSSEPETNKEGFVKFGSTPEENELVELNKSSYSKTSFWHFIMSDAKEQLKAFEEGIFELCLTEKDENWRTELLKQVKPDDLVFLYQTGANGYIGVFKAKGWRVFEKDSSSNQITESIHSYSDKDPVIKGDLQKDLELYDCYNAFETGETICSNLVVEALAYYKDGVGCPSKGPYRRTISKYKNELGIILLSRFKQISSNKKEALIRDGSDKKIPLNLDEFENVLEKGDFK